MVVDLVQYLKGPGLHLFMYEVAIATFLVPIRMCIII